MKKEEVMNTISGTAKAAEPVSKSPVIPMAASSAASSAVPRAERRREATDRKLMHATLQIAVERGISGVTIEEVARRSGVAKTTIYRRYHNSNELLRSISAMYLVSGEAGPVPSPTREHFTQLLQRLVDWVRDNNIDIKHVGIVLSSEAEFFHHIVDQVITPWLKQVRTFIGQGVAQGIFRPGIDERLLLSTIIGSLVAYEAIMGTGSAAGAGVYAGADAVADADGADVVADAGTDAGAGADGAEAGAGADTDAGATDGGMAHGAVSGMASGADSSTAIGADSATSDHSWMGMTTASGLSDATGTSWADRMADLLWPALLK